MNRRTLLKGFAAGVAGLMVPVTVAEAAEDVRRYWSLDQTMTGRHRMSVWAETFTEDERTSLFARWVEATEPRGGPENWLLPERKPYDQVTYYIGQSYTPVMGGPNHVYANSGVYVLSRDGREIVGKVS
jgi:hypothetical protein